MYIPQLIICIGVQCLIGSGPPQPTVARCREHIAAVMVIQIRQAAPNAAIRAARCLPLQQDIAT